MAQPRCRSVLITGCSRGIGLGLVKGLAASDPPPEVVFATCRYPDKAQVSGLEGVGGDARWSRGCWGLRERRDDELLPAGCPLLGGRKAAERLVGRSWRWVLPQEPSHGYPLRLPRAFCIVHPFCISPSFPVPCWTCNKSTTNLNTVFRQGSVPSARCCCVSLGNSFTCSFLCNIAAAYLHPSSPPLSPGCCM